MDGILNAIWVVLNSEVACTFIGVLLGSAITSRQDKKHKAIYDELINDIHEEYIKSHKIIENEIKKIGEAGAAANEIKKHCEDFEERLKHFDKELNSQSAKSEKEVAKV